MSLPPGALYAGPADEPGWLLVPLALVLIGGALRAWGTSYLRGEVMKDMDIHADRLIVAGPFRYTRNPLYLGNLFLAAAYGLLLPPPGLILSVGLMLLMGLALIRAEEPALAAAHPDAYAAYARAVPRLLPRLTPAPASGVVRAHGRSGLTAEVGLALLFVGAIAAVLSPVAGIAIYVVGLLILGPLTRAAR